MAEKVYHYSTLSENLSSDQSLFQVLRWMNEQLKGKYKLVDNLRVRTGGLR